jgi:hypothetical protein
MLAPALDQRIVGDLERFSAAVLSFALRGS